MMKESPSITNIIVRELIFGRWYEIKKKGKKKFKEHKEIEIF
jgi:hypothetical protein